MKRNFAEERIVKISSSDFHRVVAREIDFDIFKNKPANVSSTINFHGLKRFMIINVISLNFANYFNNLPVE